MEPRATVVESDCTVIDKASRRDVPATCWARSDPPRMSAALASAAQRVERGVWRKRFTL